VPKIKRESKERKGRLPKRRGWKGYLLENGGTGNSMKLVGEEDGNKLFILGSE